MYDTGNRNPLWWSGAVAAFVALLFYACSSWITGPTYLGDEIGYLNNAAFLGGHYVGGASSYYAGYSFLLAPLFHFLDGPQEVWRGVLVVNAIMWGTSLGLLHWTVRRLLPSVEAGWLLLAVLLVAAYPPNVVMSGYAFSQSAVAFFFMLAVATLVRVDPNRPLSVIPHAILVGVQFWIHPTGVVAPVASLLALLPVVLASRQYRVLLVHALVSIGLVLAYRYVVEPWRIAGMTPAGTQAGLHYPGLGTVAAVVLTPSAWKTLFGIALGHLSYSVVASFGATAIAGIAIIRAFATRDAQDVASRPFVPQVLLFILLAPLGCVAITALTTAAGTPSRLDHWVYGRYLDAFVLPLMAYGLLCSRKRWHGLLVAALVFAVGLWLTHGVGASGYVNRVNLSGLWPEQFFKTASIAVWLGWGAVGIVCFQWLPRPFAWAGAFVLYVFSINSQLEWHRRLLDTHSNPSEVVEFVRGNFDQGCVYFDASSIPAGESPVSTVGERGYLYSFYFYDYHFEKGRRPADWLQASCRGALLTYDPESIKDRAGFSVVGMESSTGLRVVVRGAPSKLLYPVASATRALESHWVSTVGRSCLESDRCFILHAADLARNSQVGRIRDGRLASDGRDGFLFFGPYRAMKAGSYTLRLRGDAKVLQSAYIDVVASRGKQVLMKQDLDDRVAGSLGAWSFPLPDDVSDMEIRLWVSSKDEISIDGYSISLTEDGS